MRKGMLGASVKLREGLGRWMGGLGRKLAGAQREVKRELDAGARPEPKTEAESALWQAMGWDEEAADSAAVVAEDAAAKALR